MRGRRRIEIVLFLILNFLSWVHTVCASDEISYVVRFQGVDDPELADLLKAVSVLVATRDRPPASVNILRKRAEKDTPRFRKVFRAYGYYAARVSYEIDDRERPWRVTVRVNLGRPFLIRDVVLKLPTEAKSLKSKLPSFDSLGLIPGTPIQSKKVLDVEKALVRSAKHLGYPFAEMAGRKVLIDHQTRTASITYTMDPGPQAAFGIVTIAGLVSVDPDFVRKRLPWKPGDLFDAELLDLARKRLAETNLFASISVQPADSLDAEGKLPIRLVLEERKHRTVSAEASYTTDEGIGGTLAWEHRNFFHRGERLRLEADASSLAREFSAHFEKPDFFSDDQRFILRFKFADETTDAYDSMNTDLQALVERDLTKHLRFSGGVGVRLSRTDERGEEENFFLAYLPLRLTWNWVDDEIDPTSGWRIRIHGAPYYDLSGKASAFWKVFCSLSHYWPVLEDARLVFANRVAAGVISGTSWDQIPADLRFYAGGGGSVRGYAYQTVGPLDKDDDPLGGNSVFEVNTELRAKMTQNIGMVAFLDGGSVSPDSYPSFQEKMFWAAGVGLRYYTAIGPFRVDVAFPLNGRSGVDDTFQIYISIGQAF